jgi:hypothetical protein
MIINSMHIAEHTTTKRIAFISTERKLRAIDFFIDVVLTPLLWKRTTGGRISGGQMFGGDIFGYYCTSGDYRAIADYHPFEDDHAGTDETAPANSYGNSPSQRIIAPTVVSDGNMKVGVGDQAISAEKRSLTYDDLFGRSDGYATHTHILLDVNSRTVRNTAEC